MSFTEKMKAERATRHSIYRAWVEEIPTDHGRRAFLRKQFLKLTNAKQDPTRVDEWVCLYIQVMAENPISVVFTWTESGIYCSWRDPETAFDNCHWGP